MHEQYPGGFTLIEVLFAVMLIGLVIAAIAVSSSASTMANGIAINMSTAEFLIEEIREQTATADFTTLLASNGNSHNPPIDISGTAMAEFSAFTQQIIVEYVDPSNLENTVTGPTAFVRVTVTITKNGQPVNSASWIRADL